MELGPSREAASYAVTQEPPSILWNLKVHYHVYRGLTLTPILNHINPVLYMCIICLSNICLKTIVHSSKYFKNETCPEQFQSILQKTKTKQTQWSESESELYRPSDRRLSAKSLPTFADKGCHVVSVTDPYGRILGFPDRSCYFSIK
jgi:hypothetical protein